MKAIELLEQFQYADSLCEGYLTSQINEAIKELEDLQNENKTLVKILEKYNEEMIELRKENEDLKERSKWS